MRALLVVVLLLLLAAVAAFLLLDREPSDMGDPAAVARASRGPVSEPLDPLRTSRHAADDVRTGPAEPPQAPAPAVEGIRGEVVDGTGRPLAGARVRLERLDPYVLRGGRANPGEVLATTRSEADGRFSLPLDATTWVRVTATLAGYGAVGRRVPGPGGSLRLVLPPAARLRVEVGTGDGRPVADARVVAVARKAVVVGRTDDQGRVVLEGLAPGRVVATVEADGYADARLPAHRVRAGEATSIRVALDPAIAFEGRVVDAADGGGIPDAIVHLRAAGRSLVLPPTGADGRFGPVLGAAAGDAVLVTASAPGYAPVLLPVHVQDPGGGQAIEIVLAPAEPWRGRVVDEGGRPVANARVRYTPDGIDSRPPAATSTDAEGRFELPPPPPPLPGRRVVLEATGAGGHAARALRPDDPAPPDLVLVLRRGSAVTGRVLAPEGAGAGGVTVRLDPQWREVADRSRPGGATSRLLGMNERGRLALTTATDEHGWWRLALVPDGPYLVRLEGADETTFGAATFEVAGADVDTGPLQLGTGHMLGGRVRDATGAPVAGASVTVVAESPPRRAWETVTGDDDGHFALTGLPRGAYRVRVALPGARRTAGATVDVPTEDPVDLVLPSGAVLEGMLTVAGGGPYRGRFTLFLDHPERPRGGRGLRRVLDTTDGRFAVEDVPAGEWRARVTTPGGKVGVHPSPLAIRGDATYDVRIALTTAGGLTGILRTAAGDAAPGGEVHGTHVATGRAVRATVTSAGSYRLAELGPGTWRLLARGPGGAPTAEDVEVPAGGEVTHDVRLLPAGSLRVVVVAADGTRRAGAIVTARPPGRVTGLLPFRTPPRTGPDGVVVLRDLPRGSLVVQARTLQGEDGRAEVALPGQETVEVELRVRATSRR